MRFVPTLCLREGMYLGKSLYGKGGELLLRQGRIIHNSYIDKILSLGIQGIYIIDKISEDIEIKNVISDDMKINAVRSVKELFDQAENPDSYGGSLEKTKTLVEAVVDNIFENHSLMVNMIDLKVYDEYTFYHCVNVAVMSISLGTQLNLNHRELCQLGLAAMLHDLGKVFINKDIITKPGRLSDSEYASIKKHSALGYNYLHKNFSIPEKSSIGVLQHHERFDGSGYPNGLTGDEISLFGRIIIAADIYDALTSDRPYRKSLMPSEAMEYLMGGAGTTFDPEIVLAFTKKIAAFPTGTCVKLSNGLIGIVTQNFSDCTLRPMVRIIDSSLSNPEMINLRDDPSARNITIIGIARI